MELMVKSLTWEAVDVLSVILVDPGGCALPGWEPGAHIDVTLDGHIRQYSLCSEPTDQYRYRIAVHRAGESRGGSTFLHSEVRPGDLLTVGAPRNHFELDDAPRYLFIAGGIGITPILPMVARAEQAGREWRLVYGGRASDTMAFTDELVGYGNRVTLVPEESEGRIDLPSLLASPSEETLVYACGPEGLLSAVEDLCGSGPSLHVERFAAKAQENGDQVAFEVVCQTSGKAVTVDAGTSILDALESVDIWIPSACREGICGTCEARVIEGVADHRDSLLTADERAAGKTMMTCVSRAKTARLVLDV